VTDNAPLVLISFGLDFLALTPAELAQARDLARALLGPGWGAERGPQAATQSPEPLLAASQISEVTGIPGPWFLEQARLGQIPHIKFGKYSRFRLSEVVQHGAVTPPVTPAGKWTCCSGVLKRLKVQS
jgi:hypothetical protein